MNFSRQNPGGAPRQGGYRQDPRAYPPQQPQQQYGRQSYGQQPYGQSMPQQRSPQGPGGRAMPLRLAKVDDKTLQSQYIYQNICAVSDRDFPRKPDGSDYYLRLTNQNSIGEYVVTARATPGFHDGCISLSEPQRKWMSLALTDTLMAEEYAPSLYLEDMDIEIGFASARRTSTDSYDQDTLGQYFRQTYKNQVLAPGQRVVMDYKATLFMCVVKTVTLGDWKQQLVDVKQLPAETSTSSDPNSRGLLLDQTEIAFHKDPQSSINLKGSTKRNANPILKPDFKFEDFGVGGLDDEFSTVFRKAFASRLFPPALLQALDIKHTKGVLLHGPPGTGKTLMARQIGKMLQAREPKIVNGPELLNKYVGQSEENVRKLFADAEKEYKEKGDESGLHVIIFDELDAVCKQRGSGSSGGTGVGDNIVNQFLSKMDGVKQMDNILIIGMTNRLDLIDVALKRPGRFDTIVEVNLPDEKGRLAILEIHTKKMRENGRLGPDVDLPKLAEITKNYSGAELAGLVRSAASFAFTRHIKGGMGATLSNDVDQLALSMNDFMLGFEEMKPAFGTSDDELTMPIEHGIISFSPKIPQIISDCMTYLPRPEDNSTDMTNNSILFYGPPGSGKTALAAHIAKMSGVPFIKIISALSLSGHPDEFGKKDAILKIFTDAWKSTTSIIILDNIERLIEWNPIGPRMSNTIVQQLMYLIEAIPPKKHRILVIATTSQRSVLHDLGFGPVFKRKIFVPSVGNVEELGRVLEDQKLFADRNSLVEALNLVREETNGTGQIDLGVKQILWLANNVRKLEEENGYRAQFFAKELGTLMADR